MKLGIFTAFRNLHKYYIRSCEELGIDYEVIDIIAPDWLEKIEECGCNGFLCRPPSKYQERKTMFDERLYTVSKLMKKKIYPSYDELFIYENKRMMATWLKLNKFPHSPTTVFYRKDDFLNFLDNTKFPIVIKSNIGSTSKGVKIVKSKRMAKSIANKIFGLKNTKLAIGYTSEKTGKVIPVPAIGTIQRHWILAQEFQQIKWEWRIIKIGESYFGHKKLLNGDFASGSGKIGWDAPPRKVLDMVKDICERGHFLSMSADIFETTDNKFLVNELQSIFGSYDDSQMYINDKPGRYIFKNNDFIFEEGSYNTHGSYLLRVKHFVDILSQEKKVDL